jgi:tartrate dehydratase alpha subunit/fumarate hydratase class I-like protein
MLTNKAIEEIRKARHEISTKYHHDTKEFLEHHKQLESKYSARIYSKKMAKENSQIK